MVPMLTTEILLSLTGLVIIYRIKMYLHQRDLLLESQAECMKKELVFSGFLDHQNGYIFNRTTQRT